MSQFWVRGLVVLVGFGVLVPAAGCSASRTRAQSRTKVLEAEIIDREQQTDMLRGQVAEAVGRQDAAVAQAQQAEYDRARYERELLGTTALVSDAASRAAAAEGRLDVAEQRAGEWKTRADLLEKRLADSRTAPPVAPTPEPSKWEGDSPELVALKGDLQRRMSASGIEMPVEIRTSQNGSRRVAVVIPDAFRSGEATLAYNASAVKAVVGLGRLVQDSYPSSHITVEGHTDSDPLVKTKPIWGDNANLSRARADYVKKLLTDTGLSDGQIAVAGVGSANPIETGTTKRAKSRNRRVEVFIEPR